MSQAIAVTKIVLPVLFVLLLGYFSARRKLLSQEQADGLKSFVVNFSLPAVLLSILYKVEFTWDMLIMVALVYAICIAGLGLGKLAVRLGLCRQPLLPYLTTGFEAGMLGYALYSMIFGAEHLSAMASVALGGDLFVFTLYMALVKKKTGAEKGSLIKDMLGSPVFIALAVGSLLGATGLGLRIAETAAGGVILAILNFMTAPTSCVILFVVGYGIDLSAKGAREGAKAAAIRIVIMAVLCTAAVLCARLLPTTDSYRIWALVLLFSLPGPFVLPVFTKDEQSTGFASTALSISTLVSVVLFCVLTAITV